MVVRLRDEPGRPRGRAGLEVGGMQRGRAAWHAHGTALHGRPRDRGGREIAHEPAQQPGGKESKCGCIIDQMLRY